MTQTGSTQTAGLVAGYFNQGTHYYSESEGAMIPIAEMAPKHAANAAEKLLGEAEHWASEAGATERPFTWAASAPLVRALWTRSQATSPDASEAVKAAMSRYRRGLM
jgi:acetylornithine deacetylase/succinyl-diaminopimelate desuccinylase-like protein